MLATSRFLVLCLSVIPMLSRLEAAVAAGEHAYLYRELCDLIQLPSRLPKAADDTTTAASAYMEIQKLNTSLSPAAWWAKFAKTAEGKRPQYEPGQGSVDGLARQRWPTWVEAMEATEDATKADEILKAAGLVGASLDTQQQYHALLQPIAEEAAATMEQLNYLKDKTIEAQTPTIKKALNRALFDQDVEAAKVSAAVDINGKANTATSLTELCGSPGNSARAKSVVQMLVCLCSYHSTDSTRPCESSQAQTGLNAAVTEAHTVATDLISKCPDAEQSSTSSGEISAFLSALLARFKSKATDIYIGDFTNNACNGSSGNGKCVMYKSNNKDDIKAFRELGWLKELRNVARMLTQAENTNDKVRQLTDRMNSLKQQAQNLRPQIQGRNKQPETAATTDVSNKDKKAQQVCETIKDKQKCKPDVGCTYNETTNKCEKDPKSAVVKINQEAGTGTGAADGEATTGCARHFNDKTACEKMNEGKEKPVCAWKKGKEGEGNKYKDELRCIKNSFLVGEKFALISAAFVSLLVI
uniref:Variant surface glycoprotein 682 n=1 Tax=Trypanosoma brucei TaxID=5691 RepID=M4SYX0_9TRYP|nr:variant surface glycoprotein 682 [Trypanosoma brucei]